MWMKTLLMTVLIVMFVSQETAAGVGLGPQAGYYKAKDADEGSFMGGLALRLKFLPALGAEASVNYRQEKYADGLVTVRSWPVMVSGLIYPIPVLYGALGAGWYNVTFDYDQTKLPLLKDQTSQIFGWHLGGGAEIPAGSIKLTGDIRYVFLDYDFNELPDGNLKSNFYVITVGLLFGL